MPIRRSTRSSRIASAKQGPCREFYDMGYEHGFQEGMFAGRSKEGMNYNLDPYGLPKKRSRKLSGWQKFVKANSNKKKFKYASGKLNLKKMGVAYRKTAVYKRNKKK